MPVVMAFASPIVRGRTGRRGYGGRPEDSRGFGGGGVCKGVRRGDDGGHEDENRESHGYGGFFISLLKKIPSMDE